MVSLRGEGGRRGSAEEVGGAPDDDAGVADAAGEARGVKVLENLDGEVSPDPRVVPERSRVETAVVGGGGEPFRDLREAPDRARNALDLLPAILAGVRDLAARQESDAVLGPSSVVATGVDAVPASLNVIPDRVAVTLDWRILPEDTGQSLVARVRESLQPHLDRAGKATWPGAGESVEVRIAIERQRAYTGVEAARRMFSPGFLMDPADPIVTAAARAVGTRDGSGAPARVRPWTFATDGGWTCGVRGIPTIGFAPGEERHAHTNTERLDLDEARWGYGRYLDLVPAVQRAVRASPVR